MEEVVEAILNGLDRTSNAEWVAVITALLYVYFSARKLIICWIFALISSGLYAYLFFTHQLFMESGLQAFYLVMAVYGWIKWIKPLKDQQEIKTWSLKMHVLNLSISGLATLIAGALFAKFIPGQAYPYVDAFTTVFSLAATFMVAHKILENWIYWIVIDLVSVWLYTQRDLYLSSCLMLIFTAVAFYGLFTWYKNYNKQVSKSL